MIRDLAARELAAAAHLAAAAFREDPGFVYVLPDDAQRRRRLPSLMEGLLRSDLLAGGRVRGAFDEGALVGVSAVLPAGVRGPGLLDNLRLLPGIAWFAAQPAAALRAGALAAAIDRLRKTEDDYLRLLGVHPAAQGRGVGAALLRDALKTERTLYLETFEAGNAAWYEKRGFARLGEVTSAQRPTFWTLRRKP